MDDPRSIIHYHVEEYGSVRIRLAEVMDARGITRNRLRTLTGAKYDVINRYYKGEDIARVDLDFLARVCYVLECDIPDLLEYQRPEE